MILLQFLYGFEKSILNFIFFKFDLISVQRSWFIREQFEFSTQTFQTRKKAAEETRETKPTQEGKHWERWRRCRKTLYGASRDVVHAFDQQPWGRYETTAATKTRKEVANVPFKRRRPRYRCVQIIVNYCNVILIFYFNFRRYSENLRRSFMQRRALQNTPTLGARLCRRCSPRNAWQIWP